MAATRTDILGWLVDAQEDGATHMIVACDTFERRGSPDDDCCYPVKVMPGEDPLKRQQKLTDEIIECYSLTGKHTIEAQLEEFRAVHYD